MKYDGIVNFPVERSTTTYPFVTWDSAFTPEELDNITKYCGTVGTEESTTIGKSENIRKSNVKFHSWTKENGWFFDRMNGVINLINNRWYGFNLNGYETFQYTEYDASYEGKYDWHMDICLGKENLPTHMFEPRKLSLSLLLNDDYEGGDFQLNLGDQNDKTTAESIKGRIIAFPSWMIHQVTPVTKGTRKSIVIWCVGPKFA
jgi:PKHD-type hydroxylase